MTIDRHIPEEDFPREGTPVEQFGFLMRYAVIAPSSHNTQPWKFAVKPDRVDVYIDESRWLRVADRNRRELYVSIGCALENLLVAAEQFGFDHRVTYFPAAGDENPAVTVELSRGGEMVAHRESSMQ